MFLFLRPRASRLRCTEIAETNGQRTGIRQESAFDVVVLALWSAGQASLHACPDHVESVSRYHALLESSVHARCTKGGGRCMQTSATAQTFAGAPMWGEVDALCGPPCGSRSRRQETRAGTIEPALPATAGELLSGLTLGFPPVQLRVGVGATPYLVHKRVESKARSEAVLCLKRHLANPVCGALCADLPAIPRLTDKS